MPEHAVAAILYPVVLDIKKHIPVNIGPHFIKGLLFAVIWGCSIGGVGTFLGGARNPLAISLLNEMTGTSISFIEWMIAVIPFVIVTLMLAAIILRHYFKCNFDVTDIQNELLEKRKWIGKVSFKEYLFALIFLLTIFSWMFAGNWLGVTNIALISSVLLFVLKLVSWREASEFIQWDILLMYGGAISIGAALHKTNALTPIVNWIFSEIYFSPIVIIISISVIAIILTEGISNAAVVILLLPIAINLTASQNIDPRIITLAVAVPSGLAFMMPIGNPPNALCYSSGLYTISDSARYGIVMNITSLIIFLIVVKVYWPIIGLSIP
jgi:sodium-dependent dicarboxylate transporter 2/3/5